MKQTKYTIIAQISCLLLLVFSCISFTSGIFPLNAQDYTIDEETESFVEGNYKCFALSGDEGIAIAWNGNPSACNGNFTIPSTIEHGDTEYTVKCIAEGGFRNCAFTTVSFDAEEKIRDIKAEAFASCQNLTKFVFPRNIDHIATSTFRDCRALETVHYRNSSGEETNKNSTILSIGDHAFANCVSLVSISCPEKIQSIGESAFQHCSKLFSFLFPVKASVSSISIGKYAFSDCTELTILYFDQNFTALGEHIFAECEKLRLHFNGTAAQLPSNANISAFWRKKHIATNRTDEEADYVPIDFSAGTMVQPDAYEGLSYTIVNSNILFDAYTDKTQTVKSSPGYHARIYRFDTPLRTPSSGYFDLATGALTIPNQLPNEKGQLRDVRVICSNAFSYHDDITSISVANDVDSTTNTKLIQICDHAFFNCPNIATINLSNCTQLTEVSYQVFQDVNSPANDKVEELYLPNNLKYIGAYAFYNFVAVEHFTFQGTDSEVIPQTVFIGRWAFGNLGLNCEDQGEVELLLSSKLSEGLCQAWHPTNCAAGKDPHASFDNWSSPVLPSAFEGANCLKTVDVWNKDSDLASDSKPRWSMGTRAFAKCKSLVQFRSNKRLAYIGSACFEGCEKMREVFLCATYAASQVTKYVAWGNPDADNDGGPIFGSDNTYSYPDAVIYVDTEESGIPPRNRVSNSTPHFGLMWNADPSDTYVDHFGDSGNKNSYLHRSTIPTYYGVSCNIGGNLTNWKEGLKYLDLSDNILYVDDPSTGAEPDWTHDLVAMVFKNNKYTPSRCYCNEDREEIDLTLNTSVNGKIEVIGNSAFAQTREGPLPGSTIYLPSSVTTIEERAFYRNTDPTNTRGVKTVTYKSGETSTPVGITGYSNVCVLPSATADIGTLAFYGNRFNAIEIKGNLSRYGVSPFAVINSGNTSRASVSSVSINGGGFSATESNGIYYTAEGRKTLLYQSPASSGSNSFTVDDGTLAIGPRAAANTDYVSIGIPSTVKKIYGGGFQNNKALTTFTVPDSSSLEVIGSPLASDYYNDVPFEWREKAYVYGKNSWEIYRDYGSSFGSFSGCASLTTLDFTKLGSLQKIGYGAFKNCTSLGTMCGSNEYSYYKWNADKTALEAFNETSVDLNTGVLDLHDMANLKSIGRDAFTNCSGINYAHLPNSAQLYIGKDNDFDAGPQTSTESPFNGTGARILVGETANSASTASKTRDTSRYPDGAFKNVTPYFYFTQTSDLIANDQTTVKYWTQLGDASNRRYLLCDVVAEANAWINCTNKDALIAAIVS